MSAMQRGDKKQPGRAKQPGQQKKTAQEKKGNGQGQPGQANQPGQQKQPGQERKGDGQGGSRPAEMRAYCLQPECKERNYYSSVEDYDEHSFDHLSLEDRQQLASGICTVCSHLFETRSAIIGHCQRTSHKVVPFEHSDEGGVLVVTPELKAASRRCEAMKNNVRWEKVEVAVPVSTGPAEDQMRGEV